MFERFTPRARRVIVLAQDAAREMGHGTIRPEHLLVALQAGEGMAHNAMAQAGVDGPALRGRVAALYASTPSATSLDKLPFSVEAKRCLEQSLRAALALGHNHVGTEHLFLGVQRQAEADDRSLDEVLGLPATDVGRRLTDLLGGSGPSMRSPALQAALERARARSGPTPMTTGQALAGMLEDPDNQVSHALAQLGVDPRTLQAALDAVHLADTSDASPAPQSLAITIGEATTVIPDPEVATALQRLSPEELREVIKRAAGGPGPDVATG